MVENEGFEHAPFAIIDFEASSLDENSYPIEVGVATFRDALGCWESLIRPTREWTKRDAWSRRSAAVHGITREQLNDAPAPAVVIEELNRALMGFHVVHCDGGSYDAHWLSELYDSVGAAPPYGLADAAALVEQDPVGRNAYRAVVAASNPPHRAAADAIRIAKAVVAAWQLSRGAGDDDTSE